MDATISVPGSHSSNDRLWAVLCHVSGFIGVGFILPLVVYLVMRKDSAYVADNAREALNFHISVLIYCLCCIPLMFVFGLGIVVLGGIALASAIVGIIAAVKASDGEVYRYPKQSDDLILFLKLGNGCGGAAIIDGRLLRGTSGVATEFGHMRVAEGGPRCHCGQTGCLETHVNLAALARYLAEAGGKPEADPAAVAEAVRQGDAAGASTVHKLARYLATRGYVIFAIDYRHAPRWTWPVPLDDVNAW